MDFRERKTENGKLKTGKVENKKQYSDSFFCLQGQNLYHY